ncbi:RbsD or FucU transport [Denitrovibrio acetiphilus DSM 12809]|uniref:RbsD or FucU transport n=1 Tax=Denitrovibrio acetiphilus (strain DSM 12809 / NBRC 114555 / N2460) TaxID=522772 RepID=D4H283_DENA2|nr:L-fucose mutarotase [Denitrovibrio acetiphilus]ADD68874.1 RbsD or FucU transport [Denitrovibrio acetiphilus DSM 12809]
MLKGISPFLSPELLAELHRMGHGDEIVLGDAHFAGHGLNKNTLRADGLTVDQLLDAILPLFELDAYSDDPLVMITPVEGDTLDPEVETRFRHIIEKHQPDAPEITRIDRFAFYDRTKQAYCVVMTGETAKYGCIILKKGVTPQG